MTSPQVAALPVNIDTSYADNGADASVKVHQQHHDVIHGGLQRIDLKAGYASLPAFSQAGTLAILTGTARAYADHAGTLASVRVSVGTAPTGASLIVVLYKNGSTFVTVTVAAASNTAVQASSATFAAGDYFTVSITQVGSTVAGADLTLQIVEA